MLRVAAPTARLAARQLAPCAGLSTSTTTPTDGGKTKELVQQTLFLAQDGILSPKSQSNPQQRYNEERKRYKRQVNEMRKVFAVEVQERVAKEEERRRRLYEKVQREKLVRKEARRQRAKVNLEAEARKRVIRWEQLERHWAAMQVRGAVRQAKYDALKEKLIAALEKERHLWITTPERANELITDVFWAAPGGTAGPGALIPGSEFWRYCADVELNPVRAWVEKEEERRQGGAAERRNWLHSRMRHRQQAAEAARDLVPDMLEYANDTRRFEEITDELAEAIRDFGVIEDADDGFRSAADFDGPAVEPDEEALRQFEKTK